jgi:hypothetical protein
MMPGLAVGVYLYICTTFLGAMNSSKFPQDFDFIYAKSYDHLCGISGRNYSHYEGSWHPQFFKFVSKNLYFL